MIRDDGFASWVAAVEHQDFRSNRPAILKLEHDFLVEAGLLDSGQPTRWSHYLYDSQAKAEFTPEERMMIRYRLGWLPDQASNEQGDSAT